MSLRVPWLAHSLSQSRKLIFRSISAPIFARYLVESKHECFWAESRVFLSEMKIQKQLNGAKKRHERIRRWSWKAHGPRRLWRRNSFKKSLIFNISYKFVLFSTRKRRIPTESCDLCGADFQPREEDFPSRSVLRWYPRRFQKAAWKWLSQWLYSYCPGIILLLSDWKLVTFQN